MADRSRPAGESHCSFDAYDMYEEDIITTSSSLEEEEETASHLTLHQLLMEAAASTTLNPQQSRRCWRTILDRCKSHPEELSSSSPLDDRNRNCLHLACAAAQLPVEVMQCMLAACRPDMLLERDVHGRTPLLTAILNNHHRSSNNNSIIKLVLHANPQAAAVCDHLGRLPLHHVNDDEHVVRLLLDAHADGSSQESYSGRTPLHLAIERRASIQVVRLLVEACPQAILNDHCGLNALFVALRYNSSTSMIECLVQACPQVAWTRDRGSGLPLLRAMENHSHASVQLALCTNKQIVLDTMGSIQGNTALHTALECGFARKLVVERMLQHAPEVASTQNYAGRTPLSIAAARYIRASSSKMARREEDCEILTMLIRAAYYGRTEHESPLLHAAVSLMLPSKVVQDVLSLHPKEIFLQDCDGNLPLHLVIASDTEEKKILAELKEETVALLLRHFPDAVKIPNRQGFFPLMLAAKASSITESVLTDLLHLWPCALRLVDPIHQLHLFQVSSIPRRQPEVDNTSALTNTFLLLRQAPDLVHSHLHFEI